jgi:hypothetical protein
MRWVKPDVRAREKRHEFLKAEGAETFVLVSAPSALRDVTH